MMQGAMREMSLQQGGGRGSKSKASVRGCTMHAQLGARAARARQMQPNRGCGGIGNCFQGGDGEADTSADAPLAPGLLQCRYCDVAKDDEAHKNTRAAGAQDAGGNRGSSQAIVVSALRPGPAAPRRRQHTNARDTLRSRRGKAGVLVFLRPVFHRRQPTGGGQLRALPSRAPAGQRRERLVEKQSMPTCRMHPASHASGAVPSHIHVACPVPPGKHRNGILLSPVSLLPQYCSHSPSTTRFQQLARVRSVSGLSRENEPRVVPVQGLRTGALSTRRVP
ncbi:hypothetical protein B0J12DRAFT_452892 [Macrophomina phaseolina]|uniref:Uncharacterized protein n=1 Tax=Macrophomina phaseolina TaxID=35725 RepID=A0ABQ8GGB6_9PEZI|nr:hypothetical protein B0J12DRAFT_452892 [Macrophomina phaseolina]